VGNLATSGPVASSLMAKRASDTAFFRWVQSSTSISDKEARSRLRQSLILAGFDNPNATVWYVICRFSLAILLPGAYILMQFLSAKPATDWPSSYGRSCFAQLVFMRLVGSWARWPPAGRPSWKSNFPMRWI
jgi:hypothetical protein